MKCDDWGGVKSAFGALHSRDEERVKLAKGVEDLVRASPRLHPGDRSENLQEAPFSLSLNLARIDLIFKIEPSPTLVLLLPFSACFQACESSEIMGVYRLAD